MGKYQGATVPAKASFEHVGKLGGAVGHVRPVGGKGKYDLAY